MVKGYGHALHKEGRYEAGVDVVKSCDWGESAGAWAGWLDGGFAGDLAGLER